MINAKKKSIFNGLITVDIDKAERLAAVITYAALWITYRLLVIAAIIAGIATAAAGGDGKVSDGNIIAALISMFAFAICFISAGITKKLMLSAESNIKKYKKNKTK